MNAMKQLKTLLPVIVFLVAATFACELVLTVAQISKFLFPKPSLVFTALGENWIWILTHLKVTLYEALVGFACGIALGGILALACLFAPSLESLLVGLSVGVKNVPFVAIAPMLFILLGYGPLPKIVLVMVVCFFPIMINWLAGFKSVRAHLHERFLVLKATRWQLFTKLELPTSVPYFVAGLEVGIANMVIAAIVGELLGAVSGLGFLMQMAISQYRIALLMAAVVVVTLASVILASLLRIATKVLLRKWLVPS